MFTITVRMFDVPSTPLELLKLCGFEPGGRVQHAVNESINDFYKQDMVIPASPGRYLEDSFVSNVDEAWVAWNTPYSKYQYYGHVMTDEAGRTWVGRGETKPIIHNDWPLQYDHSQNPNAGPYWFERMKANHMQDIIDRAMAAAKEG